MGKHEAYQALKLLGGQATTKEIKAKLSEKWPGFTYAEFCATSLNKLVDDGYVEHPSRATWRIVKPYPASEIVVH